MNPIDLITAPVRLAGMAIGGALSLTGAVIAAPFQALGLLPQPPREHIIVDIPTEQEMDTLRESVAARLANVEYGESVPLGGHPGQMPGSNMNDNPWFPPPSGPPPCKTFNSTAANPNQPPSPQGPSFQPEYQPNRPPPKGPGF